MRLFHVLAPQPLPRESHSLAGKDWWRLGRSDMSRAARYAASATASAQVPG